jgi:hypothetical protein
VTIDVSHPSIGIDDKNLPVPYEMTSFPTNNVSIDVSHEHLENERPYTISDRKVRMAGLVRLIILFLGFNIIAHYLFVKGFGYLYIIVILTGGVTVVTDLILYYIFLSIRVDTPNLANF